MMLDFKNVLVVLCMCLTGVLCAQQHLDEAKHYFEVEHYTEVIKILEPYAASEGRNLELIELLGDAYAHEELWDLAISNYEILKEGNPESANYHYKFGGANAMKALTVSKWRALSLVYDAKTAFLKAADLDLSHIDTRWALVKLYMELPSILGGSKDKALYYANQLQELSLVDGHLAKGFIYNKEGQFELAEHHYLHAINVGGSKLCYVSLADLYLQQGKKDKALAVLKAGLNALHDASFQQKIVQIAQESYKKTQ